MWLRTEHAELDIGICRQFIRENPLGVLITGINSATQPFLQATHIPWIVDVEDEANLDAPGKLRGHIARVNPQSKALVHELQEKLGANGQLEHDVLVLFTSPVSSYVTPKFYTDTKPSTGKVAPTWNYAAVQVYGKLRVLFDTKDAETDVFLQHAVSDLSDHAEQNVMGYNGKGRPKPWSVDEAPDSYLTMRRKVIMGLEVDIHTIQGKFKMSQEMSKGDRQGVISGFKSLGTDLSQALAGIVADRDVLWDEKLAQRAAERAKVAA